MTAKTSQHLADTLREAGFVELAVRAEADEFHDFLSWHTFPEILLAELLAAEANAPGCGDEKRLAGFKIRRRLIDGEFDASREESDEWAESADGQAAMDALIRKPGP